MRHQGTRRFAVLAFALFACGALAQQSMKSTAMRKADRHFSEQKWAKAATVYEEIVKRDQNNYTAWFKLAYAYHAQGKYERAIEVGEKATAFPQTVSPAFYNLACSHALKGDLDRATDALAKALESGFMDYKGMMKDSDLEAVRKQPGFKRLMHADKYKDIDFSDGAKLTYALVLPDDYDPGKSYPALLAISPGEGGRNSIAVGLNLYWGKHAAKQGWIVVAPMTPFGGWLPKQSAGYVAKLLDQIAKEHAIEGDKFHVAGVANSGMAAVHLAIEMPERFHSVTGLPALPPPPDYKRLDRLKNVRVQIVTGSKNEQVMNGSKRFEAALKKKGVSASLLVWDDPISAMNRLMNGGMMSLLEKARP